MDNEIITLQVKVTARGENENLITGLNDRERKSLLFIGQKLGFGLKPVGMSAIELSSTQLYCELPLMGKTRKRTQKYIRTFRQIAERKPGVRVQQTRQHQRPNAPSRQNTYRNTHGRFRNNHLR